MNLYFVQLDPCDFYNSVFRVITYVYIYNVVWALQNERKRWNENSVSEFTFLQR